MRRALIALATVLAGAGAGAAGMYGYIRETEPPLAHLAARPLPCVEDSAKPAAATVALALAKVDTAPAVPAALAAATATAPDSMAPGADSAGMVLPALPLDSAALSKRLSPPRLARVYAAMQPRQAAALMERLDDNEVQAILGRLGDRQVAGILTNLPPERGALLSRVALRNTRSLP